MYMEYIIEKVEGGQGMKCTDACMEMEDPRSGSGSVSLNSDVMFGGQKSQHQLVFFLASC